MRSATTTTILLALATLAASGCAGPSCCMPGGTSGGGIVLPDAEPVIPEPTISGDVDEAIGLAATLTGRETSYRGLTPIEAQCQAVEASTLGNLLSSEARTVATPRALHPRASHRAAVERRMLYYASQEARNRSAGDALRLYWSLAEAEYSQPILTSSQSEADATIRDLEQLTERGISVPLDANAIRLRPLELRDRALEVDLQIERLNEELKQMLDLDTWDTSWHIWPETNLTLTVEPIDVDAAVAEGLQFRPELRMLRMLQSNLDSDTLPAARRALGAINGALGSSDSGCCCCLLVLKQFLSHSNACEVAARQRQLAQYRADREAAVASEIRQGAHAVVTAAARVAVAQKERDLRATSLKNLEAKLRAGEANAFDVHQARFDLLNARAELISQFAAWETARVELRQAQGLLVDECRGMRGMNCP